MFKETEKSTFKYWFAHWCAYQMTALNLGCWKFKYLFHDIEKPWLRLFMPYDKVKKWHRAHAAHHMPKRGEPCKVIDWEAMVIDWECSRFTKEVAPLNARETLEHYKTHRADEYPVIFMESNIVPILNKLNL